METNLSFSAFTKSIQDQIAETQRYDHLRDQEKSLTADIQETTANYKKLQNDFSREQDENTKEMTELKRQKNEA